MDKVGVLVVLGVAELEEVGDGEVPKDAVAEVVAEPDTEADEEAASVERRQHTLRGGRSVQGSNEAKCQAKDFLPEAVPEHVGLGDVDSVLVAESDMEPEIDVEGVRPAGAEMEDDDDTVAEDDGEGVGDGELEGCRKVYIEFELEPTITRPPTPTAADTSMEPSRLACHCNSPAALKQ